MFCKILILGLGVLFFLQVNLKLLFAKMFNCINSKILIQQSEGMFNTGGKLISGPVMQKSCSKMSTSFANIGKILVKIVAHIDAVNFNADIDKKKGDFVSLMVSLQSYKVLFDQFGSSVTSTSANPSPFQLMEDISGKLTSLNSVA